MGDLSKHFNKAEFACKCGCGFGLKDGDIDPALVQRLEELRENFGKPIYITSGCRCDKHNRKVGGAQFSQHKLGTAADIMVRDVKPEYVYNYVTATYSTGGTGKYRLFTHLDVRPNKAFWRG